VLQAPMRNSCQRDQGESIIIAVDAIQRSERRQG
jgi:hypothetical protein